ncbi:hypothetical protein [Comamonas thiooxydans]|uniref:hypothetical protein n=1 Tax=Comamonas thiooxydans TaxID=363952 RepID=UPI00118678E5|nr:hypothetical protein [Comamonas thiooxydans]
MAVTDYEMDRTLIQLTGQKCVYPGHPLVIGFAIMSAFPSLADALSKKPGCAYKQALVSTSVPGAGSHVHTALDLLSHVEKGLLAMPDLPEKANVAWRKATSTAYTDNQPEGLAQAQAILPFFMEKAQQWFSPQGLH